MAALQVLVDDTDDSIQYTTGWWIDHSERDPEGDFGLTYNGIQHVTNTSGTQFQFTFEGTGFAVYGRSDYVSTANGTFSPSLNCVVDGTPLNVVRPAFASSNNQVLCRADSLTDSLHYVVATVITAGQALWFDYVLSVPSSTTNVTSQNETLVVDDSYSSITYSDGWSFLNLPSDFNNMTSTQTQGATMKFNFTGTGITWYGATGIKMGSSTSATASGCTYSIDGAQEVAFAIPWSASTLFDQRLFSVTDLPTGSHSLVVTYGGDENQASLVLDYLILAPNVDSSTIQTLPSSSTTQTPTTSTTSAITSSSPSLESSHGNSKANPPIGAIIGGAVGGVVFILGLILLWLLYRRRSSASRPSPRMSLIQDDVLVIPEPFRTSPFEPATAITSRPSSQSIRQTDSMPGIITPESSFYLSSPPALQSLHDGSSPHEQAHSITTSKPRKYPTSSAKKEAVSNLRLLHHDHEDSGSRFSTGGAQEKVVDVPPGYTEK